MNCPNCGVDYSDGKKKKKGEGAKRTFIETLPHYCDNYQISAAICYNCGFVAEMIKHPTGNAFYKRETVTEMKFLYSNSDYWKFLEHYNLIEQFKKFIEDQRNAGPKS